MNNTRQMFKIYDEDGNYVTVAEDADDLGLVEIFNDDGTLLSLTVEMAEDLRDCLNELIRKIQQGD